MSNVIYSNVLPIVVLVAVKSMARSVCYYGNYNQRRPLLTPTTQADGALLNERYFILLEHIFFSIIGYYVVHVQPDASWLADPSLCFAMPVTEATDELHWFYTLKIATHLEDCVFRFQSSNVSPSRPKATNNSNSNTPVDDPAGRMRKLQPQGNKQRDLPMDIHHIAAALLCLASYCAGYQLIGSIVMLLHDISDIPLDLGRIFIIYDWNIPMVFAFVTTVCAWLYWRIWILVSVVLYGIVKFGNSYIFPRCEFVASATSAINISGLATTSNSCSSLAAALLGESCNKWQLYWSEWWYQRQNCSSLFFIEMACYITPITVLLLLHLYWLQLLLLKGYRLVCSTGGSHNSSSPSSSSGTTVSMKGGRAKVHADSNAVIEMISSINYASDEERTEKKES